MILNNPEEQSAFDLYPSEYIYLFLKRIINKGYLICLADTTEYGGVKFLCPCKSVVESFVHSIWVDDYM